MNKDDAESSAAGLQDAACAICSRFDADLLFRKKGFPIVKCRRCGLVYVARRPTDDRLRSLYEQPSYFSGGDWYLDYLGHERNYRRGFRMILDFMERHVPERGTLLDVGCAAGFFLDEARQRGWEGTGVEISPQMARYAKEKLGLSVHRGPIETAGLVPESFDVVTFLDSLEHVPDALATIELARTLLRAGGHLVVMTPNIDSPWAKVMGRWWPHLTPEEHLHYFSPVTLSRLLEDAGLEAVEYRRAGHYWTAEELASKGLPGGGFVASLPGIRRLLSFSVYLNVGDVLLAARKPGSGRHGS